LYQVIKTHIIYYPRLRESYGETCGVRVTDFG